MRSDRFRFLLVYGQRGTRESGAILFISRVSDPQSILKTTGFTSARSGLDLTGTMVIASWFAMFVLKSFLVELRGGTLTVILWVISPDVTVGWRGAIRRSWPPA